MSSDVSIQFGIRIEGQDYQDRPGAYAVILGVGNQVAVLRTRRGDFLPGGGVEANESLDDALRREIVEECGREARIVRPLGFAIEYVFAAGEGHFAKRCAFFEARLGARRAQPEEDHQLTWLPISVAMQTLAHESQSWAVSNAALPTHHAVRFSADQ